MKSRAPRPVTVFRNRLLRIDGGLTLFMPPTSASQTVRVCAFPATRLGFEGIGISPDCNPENRAGPREFSLIKLLHVLHHISFSTGLVEDERLVEDAVFKLYFCI
ncbi:hypothetical protein SDJN02_05078, partial [Cucurbita argyrosperma subsp. argyrosperma]